MYGNLYVDLIKYSSRLRYYELLPFWWGCAILVQDIDIDFENEYMKSYAIDYIRNKPSFHEQTDLKEVGLAYVVGWHI